MFLKPRVEHSSKFNNNISETRKSKSPPWCSPRCSRAQVNRQKPKFTQKYAFDLPDKFTKFCSGEGYPLSSLSLSLFSVIYPQL